MLVGEPGIGKTHRPIISFLGRWAGVTKSRAHHPTGPGFRPCGSTSNEPQGNNSPRRWGPAPPTFPRSFPRYWPNCRTWKPLPFWNRGRRRRDSWRPMDLDPPPQGLGSQCATGGGSDTRAHGVQPAAGLTPAAPLDTRSPRLTAGGFLLWVYLRVCLQEDQELEPHYQSHHPKRGEGSVLWLSEFY